MRKATFFFLTLLVAASALAQLWAQQKDKRQRPKIREPYDVGCQTEEERCKRCRIYELELQLMAGKLNEAEYQSQRTAEEFWLQANCGDSLPPPDPCWGKRNFFLNSQSGEQVFKVCRTEVVNGKCKSSNDCVEVLKFQPGKDIGRRRAAFLVKFLPVSNQPTGESHLPFAMPNNFQSEWANAYPKPERPTAPFFIFLPDGKSDTVWMLKPRSPGSLQADAVVVPQVKASWFDFEGAKA
ncbi:MAG: hypothetical protein AAB316_12615, partial [Bacteroidota bacterium]